MVTQTEILKELASRGDIVNVAELAKAVGTTEGSLRSHLSKLKLKKLVEGSASEGWIITPDGHEAAERQLKIPTTSEDVGADTQSKLKYYGSLAGVDPDLITATSELILTGDPESLEHFWESCSQMDVPITNRRKWFNLWRNYLKMAIPPNLKDAVVGTADLSADADGVGASPSAQQKGRDYIIVDDMPVPVGSGLGDYSLADAKDLLSIRALRSRFAVPGQPGVQPGAASQAGASETVSDVLTALSPYLNKGSDLDIIKEVLGDKLELQRQDIISRIPAPQAPVQGKPFIDQISGFVAALSSLKEAGPLLRSILGIPESPANQGPAGQQVSVKGLDGNPTVMDLGDVINWRQFLSNERREDEKHDALIGLVKTARENVPDGIQAIIKAAGEVTGAPGSKTAPPSTPKSFECADCQTQFAAPANWAGQSLTCPGPGCGRVYTKEELLA